MHLQYPILKGAVEEWLSLQHAQVGQNLVNMWLSLTLSLLLAGTAKESFSVDMTHLCQTSYNQGAKIWSLLQKTCYQHKKQGGHRRVRTDEGT